MYKDRHIRVERVCEWCGETFMARQSSVKAGHGRFCSLAHANEWQKKEREKKNGYENGKAYWGGENWIVRWYDESGQHTTPYPRWWWTMNVGEVPEDYYVSYKDENPENIDPYNFICVPAKDIRTKNTKRHIGMKRSEESKKKMSLVKIGKPLSETHKANIGKASAIMWAEGVFDDVHYGEHNSHWRGGVPKDYPKEFYQIRPYILIRDNHECQICHKNLYRSKWGHVHHISGHRDNNDLDNLILICSKCHGEIHSQAPNDRDEILAFRSKLYWNQ